MGDISKVLGKPVPFVFRNKTYDLSPLTYALQAKFEYWLEQRATQALERRKPDLKPAEYEYKYLGLIGDMASGMYSFGSENCLKAAKSIPGLKELFFISLSARHSDITRAFVDEIFDEKIKEAMAAVNGVNGDPLVKPLENSTPAAQV